MEPNQAVYERDAQVYSNRAPALMPSERRILARLGGKWREIDMLDLGIGAGRTTFTFAAVARRYVGVDYSPRMIELAERLVRSDSERVDLAVADARDLSFLRDPFDFVLFSFNGLDSVGHEDRLKVLAEVRRLLKPGGSFLFSSHSLNALPFAPFRARGRPSSLRAPLSDWLGYAGQWLQIHKLNKNIERRNRDLDLEAARSCGWAVLPDLAHDFDLLLYYVDPVYQVRQLRDAGFETIAVYDRAGRDVEPERAGEDAWLHYYCRPAGSDPAPT